MRIITGKYKGYNIKGDNIIGTRPTMNRIKESLLAMVQNKVKDATVLDLFAGSGSLGLESLSNECKYAYFVDNNLRCIKAIDENISKLGATNARVIYKDYMKAIDYFAGSDIKFDIIYLDPPYDEHLISGAIKRIQKNNILNPNGIIVCEYDKENIDTNMTLINHKDYGDKSISIYK